MYDNRNILWLFIYQRMKCKICNKEEDTSHWINGKEMLKHQMCFNCNFWRDMLEKDSKRLPHTYCMIDGTHYVIEPDEPDATFQGFGGAKFHIRFKDGHEVITHNLWCQGEPKGYWRSQFPDTADFDWKWKNIKGNNYLIPKEK